MNHLFLFFSSVMFSTSLSPAFLLLDVGRRDEALVHIESLTCLALAEKNPLLSHIMCRALALYHFRSGHARHAALVIRAHVLRRIQPVCRQGLPVVLNALEDLGIQLITGMMEQVVYQRTFGVNTVQLLL